MSSYCYSLNNVDYEGEYSTLEEAKLACISNNLLTVGTIYYIAEVKNYTPRDFIGPMAIVNLIRNQAIFEVGEDKVRNWPDLSGSKYHEFREMIVEFFDKNYPTDFTSHENEKAYIVD